ncbi:MAG: hypothetical protein D3923_18740, partial [Candidatus Electrothrix sp. AR3]|nr:hypothetical protein [Candidatus Electrothrix sp. AR3]
MDFKLHFERSWQVGTSFFVPILINTLVFFGVSIISLGFMAPVLSAGYMQSLLLALRENRKPDVKDLFAHMELFFPLLGFSFLFVLVAGIGLLMLILPGIAIILAGIFFLVYMLPLMTDQHMDLFKAIKASYRISLEDPIGEHFAVVAVFVILASVGSSTVLGALLAHPYSCLFILSAYEEKRQRLLTEPETVPPP